MGRKQKTLDNEVKRLRKEREERIQHAKDMAKFRMKPLAIHIRHICKNWSDYL